MSSSMHDESKMECAAFREQVVHVVLGQADATVADECRAHARACDACRDEARDVRELLQGVRELQTPPATVSRSFHARLRERIASERALEESLIADATVADRMGATAAFVVHRLRQSRGLRVVCGIAAVQLFALALFALRESGDPSADVALVPPPDAVPETRGPGEEAEIDGTPADEDEPAARGVDAAIDPSDYVAVAEIKPVDLLDPPAEAEEEMPEPPDIGEQLEALERENRLAIAHYRMRLRSNPTGEGARPRDDSHRDLLRAMRWLVEQQEPDGSWNPGDLQGDVLARVGVTGLAVAALTVDAELGVPGKVQRDVVRDGLRFLRSSLDERTRTFGRVVGTEHEEALTLFNHALATFALAEHYVLHPDPDDERLLWDALERLDGPGRPPAVPGARAGRRDDRAVGGARHGDRAGVRSPTAVRPRQGGRRRALVRGARPADDRSRPGGQGVAGRDRVGDRPAVRR